MSAPMSVVLSSHLASAEAPTGAEHSLAMLAEGLARRGHRVRVVLPSAPWPLTSRLEAAGVAIGVVPCRVLWLTGWDPVPAAVVAAKRVAHALPPTGEGGLSRWIARERPDVVHVNCLPHVRAARAARRAGVPVVWHVREILPPGRRRRWFAGRLRADAGAVIAVSEATGAWIREEGLGKRLNVVPNGVRPPAAPPDPGEARRAIGVPGDGCVVGLFGQILPHKGALELVRAGRLALARHGDLRFVIAGAGPEGFIRRVAAEIAGGPEAARFHLLPPQPDGARLLAAADVVCLATTAPDPFPRSVLEAMAAGRPVAAFRSGGVAEMVAEGETGLLVDAGDVDALADAFVRLASEPGLRAALGRAGAVRAREAFSVDLHVERVESVLRRVVR